MLGEAVRGAERLTCRREHESRFAQRRERDPPDPVGVGIRGEAGGLEREPRLPGAARPVSVRRRASSAPSSLTTSAEFLSRPRKGVAAQAGSYGKGT